MISFYINSKYVKLITVMKKYMKDIVLTKKLFVKFLR